MKALLIKHDGTTVLLDNAYGAEIIHEEVLYSPVVLLHHPKDENNLTLRVMVARKAWERSNFLRSNG